jgi:hypothetical protein
MRSFTARLQCGGRGLQAYRSTSSPKAGGLPEDGRVHLDISGQLYTCAARTRGPALGADRALHIAKAWFADGAILSFTAEKPWQVFGGKGGPRVLHAQRGGDLAQAAHPGWKGGNAADLPARDDEKKSAKQKEFGSRR